MNYSKGYTLLFATAICVVCGVIVAGSAVGLRDRQEVNRQLDRQKKVLAVAGLMKEGEELGRAEVTRRFEESIRPVIVDLSTGEPAPEIDPATFDPAEALKNPETSREAPKNPAKVRRLPTHGRVFEVVDGDNVQMVVIPVEGKGLWSTLYGYLAVASDGNTIRGLTFYQHGETPGLGGEVDNPRWKALWPGRTIYGEDGEPAIRVVKGQAGSVEDAPHAIDGLSGATLTANGVTHLVQFWTGPNGFGPYLKSLSSAGGMQ